MADDRSARNVPALVAAAFRADQGRTVASLLRSFGDLDLAEESVQEAAAEALRTWGDRPPARPGAWILTAARNRAIDRLRRDGRLEQTTARMAVELDRRQANADTTVLTETVADDRLRLLYTCCHPSLAHEAQVALTLRLVAGLTTAQIAAAFLMSTSTMAARLTRAKARIRAADVPLRMPDDDELPARTDAVLRVVYLVFNQGYLARSGARVVDADLVEEAVRLARLLHRLLPEEPEAQGLLGLFLLADARRDARAVGGRLVPMAEQDRSRWNDAKLTEGEAHVTAALRRGRPGPYQLQAAIQAVHGVAADADATDWAQIAELYAMLETLDGSPVIRLNRAIAVQQAQGASAGLGMLEDVAEALDGYHLFHAARGAMLTELGDVDGAAAAWGRALPLTENEVERRFVADRLTALDDGGP